MAQNLLKEVNYACEKLERTWVSNKVINIVQLIQLYPSNHIRTSSSKYLELVLSLPLLCVLLLCEPWSSYKSPGTVLPTHHTYSHLRAFACTTSSTQKISRNTHNLLFLISGLCWLMYSSLCIYQCMYNRGFLSYYISLAPCFIFLFIAYHNLIYCILTHLFVYSLLTLELQLHKSWDWMFCSVSTPSIFNTAWHIFI